MDCEHKRIKKNFPFGRKSKARMFCKGCGKVISRKDLLKIKKMKKQNGQKKL